MSDERPSQTDSKEENTSDSSVLKSAGAMGLGTFFSRILGLVRVQVFAVLFGASHAMDAFNIAFRIPNLLRDLFAEGAMSAALVPTFVQTREKEGKKKAWRLAGLVFRVLFIFVCILTVFGMFFSEEIVSLYASAYKDVPGKFELTVTLTREIFPYFPLVALAAAFMGVLNACGKFFLPSFSSALFNLVSIVTGVSLGLILPKYGRHPIEGMAIGVVLGGLVQAFVQLPLLYKKGYRWQKKGESDAGWMSDPGLRRILFLMVPGTVGLAATQINLLVNSVLATGEGGGAVSWLNYAFRLMQFPIGIFGVSLAAATLPKVAAYWARENYSDLNSTLQKSLRQVFAINLPASAGLAFLGFPIIQLIFHYGSFGEIDTLNTAKALAAYALGLTAYSAVKVLVPACYAMGNTRVPVISSVLSVIVNIVLNLLLIGPLGFWGLALGTSITAVLNAGFLFIAVRKILKGRGVDFSFSSLGRSLLSHAFIAAAMGTGCYFAWLGFGEILGDGLLRESLGLFGVIIIRVFKIGILMALGVGLVLWLGKVFGVNDLTEVTSGIVNKLKKRLTSREG